MIVVSGLTKRYPGGHEAIKDLSFEIAGGDMVFITGHSGAGKTTLLKLLSAIQRPTAGSLIVNGQNLTALRRAAFKDGMRSLRLSGAQKVAAGLTTIEEVLRVTPQSEQK